MSIEAPRRPDFASTEPPECPDPKDPGELRKWVVAALLGHVGPRSIAALVTSGELVEAPENRYTRASVIALLRKTNRKIPAWLAPLSSESPTPIPPPKKSKRGK